MSRLKQFVKAARDDPGALLSLIPLFVLALPYITTYWIGYRIKHGEWPTLSTSVIEVAGLETELQT